METSNAGKVVPTLFTFAGTEIQIPENPEDMSQVFGVDSNRGQELADALNEDDEVRTAKDSLQSVRAACKHAQNLGETLFIIYLTGCRDGALEEHMKNQMESLAGLFGMGKSATLQDNDDND